MDPQNYKENSVHIAVDIGGTQMRAALYAPDSLRPIKIAKISTQYPGTTPLERLFDLIASLWPEEGEVAGIAVATPGPTNPRTGTLLEAPNIPGWLNVPLQKYLEDRFQTLAAIGNDANLAALGEVQFGAGKGHHNVIYMTISTGIGGGIIVDDKLLLGTKGLAAEIGHITVLPNGPLCGCGHRGHLEAVASGTAIAHWMETELAQGAISSLGKKTKLSAKDIALAAQSGDPLATAALLRAAIFIGRAVADLLHVFNPSIFILGGGVTQTGELLLDPIRTTLRESVMTSAYLDGLTLTTAALGDEAGLMGALALARELSAKRAERSI